MLRELEDQIGAPTTLPEAGVAELELDEVWTALESERGLTFNPMPVGIDDVRRILQAAGAVVL